MKLYIKNPLSAWSATIILFFLMAFIFPKIFLKKELFFLIILILTIWLLYIFYVQNYKSFQSRLIKKNQFVSIRIFLFTLIEYLHLKIFGHPMSQQMKNFLYNLSFSLIGGVISAIIIFIINIIAGRILGPTEYGRANYIQILAQIFYLPLVFGTDIAVARALSKEHDQTKQSQYIIHAFLIILGIFIFLGGIMFFSRDIIAKMATTSSIIIIIALIYGLFLGLKYIFDNVLKGLYLFKFQAFAKIIESFLAILLFGLVFYLFRWTNYQLIILPFFMGMVIFICISLIPILRIVNKFTFDPSVIQKLISYGKIVFINSVIAIILIYGDRLIVNKYLGNYELGLYAAYYISSISIIIQIVGITSNVLFPTI